MGHKHPGLDVGLLAGRATGLGLLWAVLRADDVLAGLGHDLDALWAPWEGGMRFPALSASQTSRLPLSTPWIHSSHADFRYTSHTPAPGPGMCSVFQMVVQLSVCIPCSLRPRFIFSMRQDRILWGNWNVLSCPSCLFKTLLKLWSWSWTMFHAL